MERTKKWSLEQNGMEEKGAQLCWSQPAWSYDDLLVGLLVEAFK